MGEREEGRAGRIVLAWEKLTKKVADFPGDPRLPAWKARVAEYEQSLRNLVEHGDESGPPKKKDGVKVSAPLKIFELKAGG